MSFIGIWQSKQDPKIKIEVVAERKGDLFVDNLYLHGMILSILPVENWENLYTRVSSLFEFLKVGDVVDRMIAGKYVMQLEVTEITNNRVVCGAWEFSRFNGAEIDEELEWSKQPLPKGRSFPLH